MALFLVQHGISAARDVDPGKGLTEQGREETALIAKVAKGYGVRIGKIVHSGKNRAVQTAEIYREILEVQAPLEQAGSIAPLDDVREFAGRIDPAGNCLVVGHLPYLQRLVSLLTTGSADTKVYQFQNSGLVCLEAGEKEDGTTDWYIKWALNPTIG